MEGLNFEAVQQYIETNKEQDNVKQYLQGFNQLTLDGVQKYVSEHEEGKKWFDSQRDQHFSKGLETWQKNNLEKIVGERLAKANPQETPEQKQLREMQAQLETIQREKTLETVKNKALKVATDKKLPHELLDLFVSDNEEATMNNLSMLEKVFNTHLEQRVQETFKANGRTPTFSATGGGKLTTADVAKMSREEINANWEDVQEAMKRG